MPMSHNPSRKLAAILAADIAGYSALMGADEPRTVRDLKGHRAGVLPMVGEHGGRIIDTAGDGILAEFASVVKALECAVAIQMTMAERNATVEPTRRMQFRIGVNLGDVVYDETRIYGDGINIAARLEGISEPDGVFIARQGYEQVDGKVALSFRQLCPQSVKNIAEPGRVVSVAYATRHPERVSHLILYGGFAVGGKKNDSPDVREQFKAMSTLIRLGWGADNPAFRQVFTGLFMPGATQEQMDFFNELQRRTTSPECAFRYREVVGDFDVLDLLPRVSVPTLVMHVRGDAVVPFEAGRALAAGVPGARFVAFQGQNHLFLEKEPASQRFFEAIALLLKG